MKAFSIARILGRIGVIRNFNLNKTKNSLREEDDYSNSCVTTYGDRYYYLDDFGKTAYNTTRYRKIKN